jgi:formamidopyrimidine-DNA glycosylase
MPELPEVETMVGDLRASVKGRTIIDIWTDEKKLIHHPSFVFFKSGILNCKIKEINRRGKIIVISLSPKGFLLFHPKMTGHFLIMREINDDLLKAKSAHLVLSMDDKTFLIWTDQRKFSRIEYWPVEDSSEIDWLNGLGEEPLASDFSFPRFNELIGNKKRRIKPWLMDQSVIVGIGNIYASEILWSAKVNPEKIITQLSLEEKKRVFREMKRILKKAIIERGTSTIEFRDINDEKGRYASKLKVYGRQKEKCSRCQKKIERKIIGGRSTYYCPSCQP